jgi:predicted nucleic acid-binding protein
VPRSTIGCAESRATGRRSSRILRFRSTKSHEFRRSPSLPAPSPGDIIVRSWIAATAMTLGIPVVTQDDDYVHAPGLEVIHI